MKNNMIHTLVIGGAGYVGAHLVSQLLATGRRVTVLGRSASPRYVLPIGASYESGDFGDKRLITSLLDNHQEVIHLAYATVPNTAIEDPIADLLRNLPPAVQLFAEVAKRGIKLILISSGGTVYGEAKELPIRETHSTKPISSYGVTKLTLENYAFLYAAIYGLKFICVRPSNAYGVGQRPFAGQGFVATAMASAMRGIPIKVFGSPGAKRDYIYVTDLAAGIVNVLEHGQLLETYNVSSGIGMNNTELIDAMRPLIENEAVEVIVENLPERAFDVRTNVLDASKLQLHTNWRPVVGINEGLRRTYDWLRSGNV